MGRIKGSFLAVADVFQSTGINPVVNEVVIYGKRPVLPQSQVVVYGAPFIAVPFNKDPEIDSFHYVRSIFHQNPEGIPGKCVTVVIEKDIVQVLLMNKKYIGGC